MVGSEETAVKVDQIEKYTKIVQNRMLKINYKPSKGIV
jgi:hypothetical protein